MSITYEDLRNSLQTIAEERGEWAGIPLVLEDTELSIAENYSLHKELNGAKIGDEEPLSSDLPTPINSWFSHKLNSWIYIFEEDSKRTFFKDPQRAGDRFNYSLKTLGNCEAWSVEAEMTALASLKTLVSERAFSLYFLTGMFLESSKRSKITYLFRKGKPTLALAFGAGPTKILCGLCLHPIGYYQGTFGGCLVPTDDVIAHLMMMRADEHLFWRKSNQHPVWEPTSGV